MNTWWSFIPLMAAILTGLAKSRGTLRLYFWAQAVYTPVVFFAAHLPFYSFVYAAVTLPILECCVFMLWDAGITDETKLGSLAYGLLMGAVAAPGAHYSPVTFAEGMLLSSLGLAMLLAVRTTPTMQAIGTLSLALSLFDLLYILSGWHNLNGWLPSAVCTAAFLWIIFYVSLRRENEQLPRRSGQLL